MAQMWDYDDYYPYQSYYYDTWYFSYFEGQRIYQPYYYNFTSPGYRYYRRQTVLVSLGSTYDSVSTQTFSFRGSIQAQGPDIRYRSDQKVPLGDNVFGNGNTVSRAWAQNFPLTAVEGVEYTNAVKSKMTPTQLSNREAAFAKAIDFINNCRRYGGCPARNYNFPGLNGAYVDVVINAGNNLVPSTTARPELGQ